MRFLGDLSGEGEKFSWNFDCEVDLPRVFDWSENVGGALSDEDRGASVVFVTISVDDWELLRRTMTGLFFFPAVDATKPCPFLLPGTGTFSFLSVFEF